MSATVHVVAERPYTVVIGRELLGELVPLTEGATRAALIFQPSVLDVARRVGVVLEHAGIDVVSLEVPDAEASKSVGVAERCWSALGKAGFTRNDAIVGIGGGAVTDLAGFVAATWLRGIRCLVVPTSVLAMVDAAIGGKTGINTREGKNLVGVFASPVGVLCDVSTLAELPRAEIVSGMAEVVKVGLTSDATIVSDLLERTGEALDTHGELLPDLIRRAVQVKADVVGADFQELGGADGSIGREVLNYGHTLGHAIELCEDYTWRHGNAVAVGLMFAGEVAHLGGRLDAAGVGTHREILDAVGLPRTYRRDAWPSLREAMSLDKKTRGSTLRFVVLEGLQKPTIWRAPEPEVLIAAYNAISA